MSAKDLLLEALRIGDALEENARGQPMSFVPRGAGVGTNLEPAPHITKRQVQKLATDLGIAEEPQHIGMNLWSVATTVTPRMARHWLSRRNGNMNRPPTDSQLATLARDLTNGKWVLMDQGISFNAQGGLENGQHRCFAIMVSREPGNCVIMLNIPPGARRVIDQTVRRTARHLIKMTGGQMISSHQESVIRRAMFGIRPAQQVSIDEKVAFAADHKRAFEWLFKHFNRTVRGVTLAPVEACIFRAYVSLGTGPRKRLEQFANYLVAQQFLGVGRYSPQRDAAVATFRDWLLGGSKSRKGARPAFLYGTTAYMLQAYLEKQDAKIRQVDEDPFEKPVLVLEQDEAFNIRELVAQAKSELGITDEPDDEDA